MPLTRREIVDLIPHGESMCMLDEVVSWDSEHIHCRSTDFARASNPLFEKDQLHSVMLIEYAAQAAAVHAALLHSKLGESRPAYLGAVKSVELLESAVDNNTPIDIDAHCLLNSSSGAIYEVLAQQGQQPVMRGRLVLNQPQI